MSTNKPLRRWPLVPIAAPAAVAVWSGWVGLGQMCGFGVVHPLPGIVDSFTINSAITLPVGVEAYGAYALGAWLTPGTPETARAFARGSAIGALALGMLGQVVYHLLAAAHAARAPWPVTVLVACLPVVTLGFGAALTHLLRTETQSAAAEPQPEVAAVPAGHLEAATDTPADASGISTASGDLAAGTSTPGGGFTPVPSTVTDATADTPGPGTIKARLNGHAAKSEKLFAADLEAGRIPGLRRIQAQLHVGQPKARLVQAHLRSLTHQ